MYVGRALKPKEIDNILYALEDPSDRWAQRIGPRPLHGLKRLWNTTQVRIIATEVAECIPILINSYDLARKNALSKDNQFDSCIERLRGLSSFPEVLSNQWEDCSQDSYDIIEEQIEGLRETLSRKEEILKQIKRMKKSLNK